MSVEFNEPSYQPTSGPKPAAAKVSLLSRAVIGAGLAKNEKGAQRALLVIFIFALLGLGLVYFFFAPKPEGPIAPVPEPASLR